MRLSFLFSIFSAILVLLQTAHASDDAQVNIYSSQKEHLVQPILEAFTAKTGIQTNLVTAKDAQLIVRLEEEGGQTPADVLMVADIGNMYAAKQKGLLQSIESDILRSAVPERYRGVEGQWYAVALRARAIFYAKDRVEEGAVTSYADLADPEWKGKVLIRSSNNIYNQSLLGSIIVHEGEDVAQEWAKGIATNFARTPQGGDTDQLRALAAGEGDLAVANTYYFGRLLASDKEADKHIAESVGIIFPNQDSTGTHVNVRAAAVTKHAKHQENAIALLEFLVSDDAQQMFAELNHEFPVKEGAATSDIIKGFGSFKHDTLSLEKVGKANAQAVKLFDAANWP